MLGSTRGGAAVRRSRCFQDLRLTFVRLEQGFVGRGRGFVAFGCLRPQERRLIIVMNHSAPQAAIDRVVAEIEKMGNKAHLSRGEFRTVIGAVGEEGTLDQNHLSSLDGVEKVVQIMKPYKLASREFHEDDS